MLSLVAVGWLMSILLVFVGGFTWVLCYLFRPLNYAEIEGMKRGGRFDGEHEYMQEFRITRAEFDLEDNLRYSRYAVISVVVGIIGILILGCKILFL